MRKIAKAERIDRSTVYRILTKDEVVLMMAQLQSRLHLMGYKAVDVYGEALDSEDLKIATPVATKVLEGIGVLDKRGLLGMIKNAKTRSLDDDDDDDDSEYDVVWPPEGNLKPQPGFTRKKPPKPQS